MNGTFVNRNLTTGDTGISFEANDTLTIQGTNADGTTFQTVFTIVTDPLADRNLADGQIATIGGLIDELNNRDRTLSVNGPTLQSSFRDAVMTLTGKGTLELIDDIADTSQSNFYMIVDDHNSTRTLTDKPDDRRKRGNGNRIHRRRSPPAGAHW